MGVVTALTVPDPGQRADLAEFVARVVALDPTAGVRLRGGDNHHVTAWAATPFDVLATRSAAGTLDPADVAVPATALLTALAVEPMRSVGENDATYVNALMARLQEIYTVRQIAAVKGRLQRMNPVEASDDYMKAFKQLMDLEQLAISLRKRATGGLTP